MKTTTKTLTGLMVVSFLLSTAVTQANPLWFAPSCGVTSAVISQATPSTTSTDPRQQADDLLSRAKQAMAENRLDVAEQLIVQAEQLRVRYNPLNQLAYTPAKARQELQRKKTASSGQGALSGLAAVLPFGNQGQATPPTDPFLNHPATMPTATRLAMTAQAPGSKKNFLLLQARQALAMGDAARAKQIAEQAKAQPLAYGPKDDTPMRVEAAIEKFEMLLAEAPRRKHTEGYRRQFAKLMMEQSEAVLGWNDFETAERLAYQANDQRVTFSPLEPNPNTLLERINTARRTLAQKPETSPNEPSVSPSVKRRANQLIKHAQASLDKGDLDAAEAYARVAVSMQVPEASFDAGQMRPSTLMQEIQKRRSATASGVVPAANYTAASPAPQAAMQAVYHTSADPTQNIPAANIAPSVGQPQLAAPGGIRLAQKPTLAAPPKSSAATPAMTLFQQGENALQAKKFDEAINYFQQAAQLRNQLDPETANRLNQRLQLLSPPTATGTPANLTAASPEAIPTPTTGQATSNPLGVAAGIPLTQEQTQQQQLLARQILNDLTQAERKATQIRESDPNGAVTELNMMRKTVEAASLDPVAKATLMRRANRSLANLNQYIKDNEARLSLNQQNQAILEQVERERQHVVEVRQKLAQLIEHYNQKVDEHSFAEAEVIAKQAYDLAPEEPVARQVWDNAKFLRRFTNNLALRDEKEDAFVSTMFSVERSSIPFDDSDPYRFPDAKTWDTLTKSRARLSAEQGPARSEREIEIEQKLKTPVSLSFDKQPLGNVLNHLAQLSEINVYLDPQGFSEENVSTDQPVTIHLQNEISLKSALNLILSPYHLSYVIKDEVLKITSEDYRDQETYTATYQVADLVIPIPNFVPNPNMGLGGAYNEAMRRNGFGSSTSNYGSGSPMGVVASDQATTISDTVLAQASSGLSGGGSSPMGFGPGGAGGGVNADFDSLIELITTTIAPESWAEFGGPGSVQPFESNMTLVISQTQEVHENIVDLFEQLRRLQDLQVTIEVRFITLNDNFFERIGVDFDFDIDDNLPGTSGFGRIVEESGEDAEDDEEAGDFLNEPLRDLRDVDNDRSVTVGMSAPGVFSADLDIPFRQGSYGLSIPQFGGYDPAAGATVGFAILSEIEAFFFIEAAQGDTRTNVLQAPKVTLFNGQMASIQDMSYSPFVMSLMPVVGDFAAAQQPIIVILAEGTSLNVQAVVSSDRRFVRLTVVPYFSSIGDVRTFTFSGETTSTSDTSTEGNQTVPDDASRQNDIQAITQQGTTVQLPTYSVISVSTTVSVPDGGTVLLGGIKRLNESRNEYGVPMLNKIPYVSRLFKNVGIGRETQSLMMMVTPRIIIQEEEEERVTAGPGGTL